MTVKIKIIPSVLALLIAGAALAHAIDDLPARTLSAPTQALTTRPGEMDPYDPRSFTFRAQSIKVSNPPSTTPPAPPPPTPAAPPPTPPAPPPPAGVTWMYLNGKQTLAGDFTQQGTSVNYRHSTSAGYNGGKTDILFTSRAPWGLFIPYWASNYQLPNPGYTNLLLSLKPSISGDTFSIHAERYGDQGLPPVELMNYGPPAVAGRWGSYVIPLKDLGVYGDRALYKVVLGTHTSAADSWEMEAIGFQ